VQKSSFRAAYKKRKIPEDTSQNISELSLGDHSSVSGLQQDEEEKLKEQLQAVRRQQQ